MNKIKLMFLLLAGLTLGACSSSDDDSNIGNSSNNSTNTAYTETSTEEAPMWQIDWSYNQERPNFTEPDYSTIYENWTNLKVQIEDALIPYASGSDLLAIFINGELRGLAGPAVIVGSNQAILGKFMLKVWGNESGSETVNMKLMYYSHTLKHLFTLTDNITLNPDETIGIDTDFIPEFTYGSAKYPVVMDLSISAIIAKASITPVVGDYFAAFVGEECRGTGFVLNGTSMPVYGREEGESITLKYYQSATGKVFIFSDVAKMKRSY